jgi:hypothetical protein
VISGLTTDALSESVLKTEVGRARFSWRLCGFARDVLEVVLAGLLIFEAAGAALEAAARLLPEPLENARVVVAATQIVIQGGE